ncbi:zinc metalloprotease [Granulicella mallensis]|uniref:hypothetical protein n=1 Tax=Granulicella mallensis TaxID=940614 RepID=UPI0012370857|nr:hypothetical protein [Granulicella mallensis]
MQSRTTTLQFRLGNAQAMVAQSVIKRVQVWHPTEMPLKVAFLGGSNELRTQIASTIRAWSANSGVSFDFGQPGAFHEWSRLDQTYQAQIRISFDEAGYWSWVGAESIDQSIAAPNQPSMNFGQFTEGLPDDWQGTVLHEFGHAIGFEHEHQSPAGDCDHEFRWDDDPGYVRTTDIYGQFVPDGAGKRPGIYSVLEGPPNNWSKDQIDFNLKSLPATIDLRFSVFDPASIMMYSFADWMFVNGAQSSCYTKENLTLSALDLKAAAETYPPEPSLGTVAQQDVAAARKLLLQKKLPAEVKAHLQERLAAFQ